MCYREIIFLVSRGMSTSLGDIPGAATIILRELVFILNLFHTDIYNEGWTSEASMRPLPESL